MTFKVGDRVVAESESTERAARFGTVREVLREAPAARYRIDWTTATRRSTRPQPGRCTRLPRTGSRRAEQFNAARPLRAGRPGAEAERRATRVRFRTRGVVPSRRARVFPRRRLRSGME